MLCGGAGRGIRGWISRSIPAIIVYVIIDEKQGSALAIY
jgi:hypothetical protein